MPSRSSCLSLDLSVPATPSLLARNSCTPHRVDASSTASRMLARALSAPMVMGLDGPASAVARTSPSVDIMTLRVAEPPPSTPRTCPLGTGFH